MEVKEVLNISARKMDYVSVKGATAIDFRANNDKNFENLKNSIVFMRQLKVYIYKIKKDKSIIQQVPKIGLG